MVRGALLGVIFGIVSVLPAGAFELNGYGRFWLGTTDAGDLESDEEDQAFQLNLSQDLSPWLSLFASYRSTTFRSTFDLLPVFEQSSEQPEIGLLYRRPNLNARLSFSDRAVRNSDQGQDLDIQSLLASLSWSPRKGPRLGFRYQDSTSTADPAAFGRDTQTEAFDLRLDYSRATWNARYSYGRSDISNSLTGLKLEQDRHELRGGVFRTGANDRWSVSLDSRVAQSDQTQEIPAGTEVLVPVPISLGLSAIDATPDLGSLDENATLIDGDLTSAATPQVEIGGANTFRNIGVDLGITRPVSALEITVDGISGAALVWEVYEGPDNLSWFPVAGAVSTFDAGFLRYTVRFPETTNRYFKAVNRSVNPVLAVSVTEIRALVATEGVDRTGADGEEYWVNLRTSLRPSDRVELALGADLRRDDNLVATNLQRSYEENGLTAQLRLGLAQDLELRLGYRASELEERVAPAITRSQDTATVDLEWNPRETVNVVLSAVRRDETDGDVEISSSDNLTLRALTRIWPGLSLVSTVGYLDTINEGFGFEQTTVYVIESIEATPNDRWILSAGVSHYEYDSRGTILVTSRSSGQLRATWLAAPFLSVNAELFAGRDNIGDTVTQRFGLTWSPGQKLSISASYYDTDSASGSGTGATTFDASYRLNRWTRFWMAAFGSETSLPGLAPTTTDTARIGFSLIF